MLSFRLEKLGFIKNGVVGGSGVQNIKFVVVPSGENAYDYVTGAGNTAPEFFTHLCASGFGSGIEKPFATSERVRDALYSLGAGV